MTYPTTLDTDFGTVVDNVDDVDASHMNELRRAVEGIEAKLGINSSAVTTSIDYKVNNFFVTGGVRKLYFYENTAPTGWTIVGAVTDKILGVKGGSIYTTGGTLQGTWTQPSHQLSIAEMPIHAHRIRGRVNVVNQPVAYGGLYSVESQHPFLTNPSIENTGSGSVHNHGTTYRPYAAVGIIASKN